MWVWERGTRASGCVLVVVAVAIWVTGAFGGVATRRIAPRVARAAAAGCRIAKLPNAGRQAGLVGVSVTSSRNAWAVGIRSQGASLIEHWNGKVWKVQPSSNRRGADDENLVTGVAANSVAATSTTDAWAINSPLIEHWNGKAWKIQPSPRNVELAGVAATSPANAWTVGTTRNGGRPLIEHWNGKAWKIQASPNPAGASPFTALSEVAATSARNAWAVGAYWNNKRAMWQTLIEHWNGKAWTVKPSPTPLNPDGPSLSELSAVAATSSTNAWAVGFYWSGGQSAQTLIVHWNGKAWTIQPSPPLSASDSDNRLLDVAATSPANAWAVGTYENRLGRRTVVEHWDGKAWTVQPSPNLRGFAFNQLSGVATTSSTNAWAVGYIARLDNPTRAPGRPSRRAMRTGRRPVSAGKE